MIGLGPHDMSTADWVFIAALQVGLIVAALFAVWHAARATRPRLPRSRR